MPCSHSRRTPSWIHLRTSRLAPADHHRPSPGARGVLCAVCAGPFAASTGSSCLGWPAHGHAPAQPGGRVVSTPTAWVRPRGWPLGRRAAPGTGCDPTIGRGTDWWAPQAERPWWDGRLGGFLAISSRWLFCVVRVETWSRSIGVPMPRVQAPGSHRVPQCRC